MLRKTLILVWCFALSGALLVSAQQTIPPVQILPKEFRNWHLTSCFLKPIDIGLWKEAGLRNVNGCEYLANGKAVDIRLAQLHDSSSAFEVYTSLLKPGEMPTNLGQVAAFDKDGVLIQEGSLVLESTANISKEDLRALVLAVEAKSEKSPLPPVRIYLPTQGRMVGSERYALGPDAFRAALENLGSTEFATLVDAIGFNLGAEAMLARYQAGKQNGVLLLIDYPTPQLAEQHIHHLQEALPEAAKERTVIERKGSLLLLVLSPTSAEFAEALRNDVNYETQVTWNEPRQSMTDPPWSVILARIFIGTGIFMIAAVILGIAFGGLRVLTKKFLPGKVFDRADRLEILQLGLSGKRIDPGDFYR